MSTDDNTDSLRDPAPGQGAVYVTQLKNGAWAASWQEDADSYMEFEGTKEDVMSWARLQPAAAHYIFSYITNQYVDLPISGEPDVGIASTRPQKIIVEDLPDAWPGR